MSSGKLRLIGLLRTGEDTVVAKYADSEGCSFILAWQFTEEYGDYDYNMNVSATSEALLYKVVQALNESEESELYLEITDLLPLKAIADHKCSDNGDAFGFFYDHVYAFNTWRN